MNRKSTIWYSFSGEKAHKNQISFYDTSELEWVAILESNYFTIKTEVLNFIANDKSRLKHYFNKNLVTKDSIWRTSAFLFWKWNFKENQKACPNTMKAIGKVPNLVSASISILESGSEIKPHRGDTNGIMRGHLPLLVPKDNELLGFQVNDEIKMWEEGKLILFNDAAYHKAWNRSQTERIILIIDVIRPEFVSSTYQISSTILSSLIYQNLSIKFKLIKQNPQAIKNIMIKTIAFFINPLLRIRNI